MTQKDKELLLKDLCARLPYGVKCQHFNDKIPYALLGIDEDVLHIDCPVYDEGDGYVEIEYCKPYLRAMSNMTEEEEKEYKTISIWGEVRESKSHYTDICPTIEGYDWLNAHHFDYRGLIEKGLAIEVTEENNPYKD